MKKTTPHIRIAVLTALICALLASRSSGQVREASPQVAKPNEPSKGEVARARAEIKRAVAAINKNKAESEALAAAVRSKRAAEVEKILTRQGVRPGRVAFGKQDYEFCWQYIHFHWVYGPCIILKSSGTWDIKG